MKKTSKALNAFLRDAQQTDSFWVEKAKLEFALELEERRKDAGLAYKALAEKLNVSPAYITKVFRGDTNTTIETMVKLARAVGGRLDIEISEDADVAAAKWAKFPRASFRFGSRHPQLTAPAATTLTSSVAANHEFYNNAALA